MKRLMFILIVLVAVMPADRVMALNPFSAKPTLPSIYELPYSVTLQSPDWHRLWINTAVLTGAYVSTLFVLEMLPEDATTWNRASLQQTPFYERWWKHNFKKGPEWDSDNPVFNYILHPYAGAVYFMAARSNGFNLHHDFDHRLGVRHRSMHGAPVLSGPIHHPAHRQCNR